MEDPRQLSVEGYVGGANLDSMSSARLSGNELISWSSSSSVSGERSLLRSSTNCAMSEKKSQCELL